MEVVSPTSVAAPCRLEETAMAMIMATGSVFSFRHTAMPTGATIRTVATLSMNAETMPENRDMRMVTHMTLGALCSSASAMRPGICEAIK